MESILTEIELLRYVMEKLGLDKGIDNPDVIVLSQKLDRLLNKYYKACHRKP